MKPTAILLAAGTGSRLRPLTDEIPKCLVPVGGTPLLGRILMQLQKAGISQVRIVTGYKGEAVEKFVKNGFSLSIEVFQNPEFEATNNAVSLGFALKNLKNDFLLLDGDLWLEDGLLKDFIEEPSKNAMVLDTRPERLNAEAMKALLTSKGNIARLHKTISISEAAGEYIGLSKFSSQTAQALATWIASMTPDQRKTCYYEDALNALVEEIEGIKPWNLGKRHWMEIDTPEDLEEANRVATKSM